MGNAEVERWYTPADAARRPDLAGLPDVTRAVETEAQELLAVYFDSPGLALLRAGVTLLRRSGGDDEGWHLKPPAGSSRAGMRLPLPRARNTPPKPMREAVAGWTRGTDLAAVARLATRRTVIELLDREGAALARFTDDDIEGVGLAVDEAQTVSWRQWKVELLAGQPRLLGAAGKLMADAGAAVDRYEERLERILGPAVPPRPSPSKPKKRQPARAVIYARIAAQVSELGRRDCEVRRGKPEGVHKARVACRRLRGVLATYRTALDQEVTEPIRAELRWVVHVLSEARDLDVTHARLLGRVDDLAPALVMGPVRRRIERVYAPRRKAARERALQAVGSGRYFALRDQLDQLAAAPPWTAHAEDDAKQVLPRCLRKDLKRLRKRVRRVGRSHDQAERDEAIHAARRAAKRLRYAAEALQPASGKDAKNVALAAKRMTSALGVRQDAVVTMPQLVDLAKEAETAGESSFTYGILYAAEQCLAADMNDNDRISGLFSDVERAVKRADL